MSYERSFDLTSEVVQTAAEFRQRVKTMAPDVVLADYNLVQWRGTEALRFCVKKTWTFL